MLEEDQVMDYLEDFEKSNENEKTSDSNDDDDVLEMPADASMISIDND